MIGHCDSSFLHGRFQSERLPLSHQLPRPSTIGCQARQTIESRDALWSRCKLFQIPSAVWIAALRLKNDAVVKILAGGPRPFSADLTHVELLLCKLCEIFCSRCELEILSVTRRPGTLPPDFVKRSIEMALAPEEPPPAEL